MRLTALLTCICAGSICFSKSENQKPCLAPESSQFDFWVGDWIAICDTLKGTNRIEKLFGNCIIHENFANSGTNFLGQSWSVYNTGNKKWQQPWIDNQGGYIALTGGMTGDSMILITAERAAPSSVSATGKIMSRMVYYNITPDAFGWSWEASNNGEYPGNKTG